MIRPRLCRARVLQAKGRRVCKQTPCGRRMQIQFPKIDLARLNIRRQLDYLLFSRFNIHFEGCLLPLAKSGLPLDIFECGRDL